MLLQLQDYADLLYSMLITHLEYSCLKNIKFQKREIKVSGMQNVFQVKF